MISAALTRFYPECAFAAGYSPLCEDRSTVARMRTDDSSCAFRGRRCPSKIMTVWIRTQLKYTANLIQSFLRERGLQLQHSGHVKQVEICYWGNYCERIEAIKHPTVSRDDRSRVLDSDQPLDPAFCQIPQLADGTTDDG